MTTRRVVSVVVVLGLLCAGVGAINAWAIDLGDVLKVGGVALLVTQYDSQIDKFINNALGERDAAVQGATKVVPILSLGGGGYVGAAQVVGNPESVKRVKAVFQVEGNFGSVRAQVLLPTEVEKTKSPERAKGVGVSAVVEFRI
ncbi:MAG: hypothetical protein ACE149_01555 [Armatimonadota bacterium]